jgi:hypothetical protein
MKILQFNCREENGIDLRQANAVLRHKPDTIIYEAPSDKSKAYLFFDPKESIKKQENRLKELNVSLRKISKKYPWVMSDIKTLENVIELSKTGHKTKIYYVDSPRELLRETIINKWNLIDKPRHRGVHLLWWVYIYLREKIMSQNIEPLLKNKNQSVLMFIQKFHWLNVKFLLSKPTKNEIWKYYFGRFKNVNKKNISETIKLKNKVLYKYWNEISDF